MLTTPSRLVSDLATIRPTDVLDLGPGQYPRIVINRLVRIRGTPGAMVESISVENPTADRLGGAVQVEDITFGHNNPTPVHCGLGVTDNIDGLVASRIRWRHGQYANGYIVTSTNPAWPGPRGIRINDARGSGFTQLGRFVDDATDGVETDVALFAAPGVTNVFYTRAQKVRNWRMVRCLSMGGDTGIRGGGNMMTECYAEGAIVGIALEVPFHTMKGGGAANCSRYECDLTAAGPVEFDGVWFMSSLPASAMESDGGVAGKFHKNLNWNKHSGPVGWNSVRSRMYRGGCYTRDPAPSGLMKSERDAGYETHLVEATFVQGSPGQQVMQHEIGSDPARVFHHRTRTAPVSAHGMVDPERTLTRYLAEVLRCTPAEFVTRTEPIQAALDWMAAGREEA